MFLLLFCYKEWVILLSQFLCCSYQSWVRKRRSQSEISIKNIPSGSGLISSFKMPNFLRGEATPGKRVGSEA